MFPRLPELELQYQIHFNIIVKTTFTEKTRELITMEKIAFYN